MIFERVKQSKRAQSVSTVVKLIVGMVIVGMLIYIGYKYILGTGENVGKLGGCEGQGGSCLTRDACNAKTDHRGFPGMNCAESQICCIPQKL